MKIVTFLILFSFCFSFETNFNPVITYQNYVIQIIQHREKERNTVLHIVGTSAFIGTLAMIIYSAINSGPPKRDN